MDEKSYILTDSYGDEVEVIPKLNMYRDNDNLYIGLDSFDEDLEGWDSYCDLTVNLFELPYLESAVDITYSGEEKIKFLTENGFGEPTGQTIASGFCVFPVFRFNEDKLKEIDPVLFAQYAKAHGKEIEQHSSLNEQIKDAEQKADSFEGKSGGRNVEKDMPDGRE